MNRLHCETSTLCSAAVKQCQTIKQISLLLFFFFHTHSETSRHSQDRRKFCVFAVFCVRFFLIHTKLPGMLHDHPVNRSGGCARRHRTEMHLVCKHCGRTADASSVHWQLPASDKKHQIWKMKPAANRSTSNIFSSYLRRCLKRACMVSWLGFGSCLTSSLVDWTLCLGSGFSAGDKQSQRADRLAKGGHGARQNLLMALTKSWKSA